MPLDLSPAAYLEKNKMASDGAWLILLQIDVKQLDDTIRLVRNTEDVVWNGFTWQAFPFELDEISENSKGEIPKVQIKVSNVRRQMEYYLEQADGGVGSTVTIRVVHSKHLDLTSPEVELVFEVTGTKANATWATFTLGATSPYNRQIGQRVLKSFCRHNFKDARCKYGGAATECDHTLTRCRQLGNSVNFGGFPGVGMNGGLYV
jgi:lambda family phage minor tail protein L